jgi:ABC-type transport system involved in multi-copper enzyme maturation permease subunit
LPSPEKSLARGAPVWPLLVKELREIVSGRAVWTLLLLACPLIGYSFFQSMSLYGEASAAAATSPVLAVSLSPLDGILVPTFGSFYVAVTLLFPFVAIRALGEEKQTGALRLLVQLPYRTGTLVAVKLAAIFCAWFLCAIPVLSSVLAWWIGSGHLSPAETLTLVMGHLLYGLLIGAVALFAASITESSATAAIVTLAFTIGSWVLDFTVAGRPGWLEWLAGLSLTHVIRTFEQGLLSARLVAGVAAAICVFAALATIWLPPGIAVRQKLMRSAVCAGAAAAALVLVAQIKASIDVTEDRRNSFALADARQLAGLSEPLDITVHLAAEDPRYIDLQRNVLSKLERVMPRVSIHLATARQSFVSPAGDESYGEIEYRYADRADTSRSTSPREILPLIYGLAALPAPAPIPSAEYPGYPLAANGDLALVWFLAILPALIVLAWWRARREASAPSIFTKEVIMKNSAKAVLVVATLGLTAMLLPAFAAPLFKPDFSGETAGAEPKSLVPVVGIWRMEADGGKTVLAVDGRQWKEGQSSAGIADKARALYGERYAEFLDRVQAYAYYPYVVAKDVDNFTNGEISVRFQGLSGRIDQGAGILFNLKPNGDYLTIRANCLENNLVLWKFEKGRRSSVEWVRNTPTAGRQWHDLKVRIAGDKVEGFLDGKLLLQHTWREPISGKIGLWSKADSYMHFDQFAAMPDE